MKMKHPVLWLLIFLLTVPAARAQSKKELAASLSRDLEAYRRYSLQLDFDSIFEYMPVKMFDIIPRDSLKAVMTMAMNNQYMAFEMTGFKYTGKRKIKKAGIYPWAFVTYDGKMNLLFKGESGMNKLMMGMMKTQFGSKNVVEKSDNTLEISMPNKQMIAFLDQGATTWSFIEDKRKESGRDAELQKMIYETVVPEEVRKAIEKKK